MVMPSGSPVWVRKINEKFCKQKLEKTNQYGFLRNADGYEVLSRLAALLCDVRLDEDNGWLHAMHRQHRLQEVRDRLQRLNVVDDEVNPSREHHTDAQQKEVPPLLGEVRGELGPEKRHFENFLQLFQLCEDRRRLCKRFVCRNKSQKNVVV